MKAWAWWEAVARLERIKQIANRHVGPNPPAGVSRQQICHIHLITMGIPR